MKKPNPFLPNKEAEKYIPYLEYTIDEMITFKNEVIENSELNFSTKFDYLVFNTIIFGAPVDGVAENCGYDLIKIRSDHDLKELSEVLEFIIVYAEYESVNEKEKLTQLEEQLIALGKKYGKNINLEELRKYRNEAQEFQRQFEKAALEFMKEVIKSL